MELKIVGAGLGRTGTFSLKAALETVLGAPCYHMAEVFEHLDHVPVWHEAGRGAMPDWRRLFSGYAAVVDWPACSYWEEIAEAFPDAKILLSTRSPESWWESVNSTIFPSIGMRRDTEWYAMIMALFGERFTTALDDREACIAAFERHYAHVRANAPADRLIEWRPQDGWAPLCAALDVPIPDLPFPRVNTREEFQKNFPAEPV